MEFLSTATAYLRDFLPKLRSRGGEAQSLVVLEISLQLTQGDAELEIDLGQYGTILPAGRRTWRLPFSALGAPTTLTPETEPHLDLSLQVTEGLRASLTAINLAVDQPLWLDLKRPYGYLGILPWERVLGQALGRPILRLPDLLQPARENADVLDAAILFDPPPETPVDKAIEQVIGLATCILQSSSRLQTTVHIFPNAEWHRRLFPNAEWHRRLRRASRPAGIRLHDPAQAETSNVVLSHRRSGLPPTRMSSWTNWMARAAQGRSLDAVHFVSDAKLTDGCAGLLLSSSPSPDERIVTAVLADVDELGALLTRTGASTAMFSPPADSSSGIFTAFVADALSHSRPGPVLYHSFATADDAAGFKAACQLLFSESAMRAPSLERGFLYCYPAAVADQTAPQPLNHIAALGPDLLKHRAPLAERLLTTVTKVLPGVPTHMIKNAPNWVGAAQRFVERATFDQVRRAAPDVLLSSTPAERREAAPAQEPADLRATQEALADIQNAVKSYLQKSGRS